jgi:tetratricopeptide (TPR) repeat protein
MNISSKIFIGVAIGVIVFGIFYFSVRGKKKHTRISRTASGDRHYANGDIMQAVQEYKKSTNPEAKITQALIVANDIGDFNRAERILENVVREDPEYLPEVEEILQTFEEERERQYIHDHMMDLAELERLFQQMLLEDARNHNIIPTTDGIRDDPQNVHDHFVQNDYKLGIERLKDITSTQLISSSSPDQKLIEFKNSLDPNSAEKKVYDHIKDLSEFKIGEGETPLEIIKMALEVPKTSEEKENLYNELRLELRSALGPNGVVCMTGIRTRILGSLEVIDEKFKLRPEWAIREEITSKIAQYRENILNSFTDEQRTKYNAGDLEVEKIVQDRAKKMFDEEYSYLPLVDRQKFETLFLAL